MAAYFGAKISRHLAIWYGPDVANQFLQLLALEVAENEAEAIELGRKP